MRFGNGGPGVEVYARGYQLPCCARPRPRGSGAEVGAVESWRLCSGVFVLVFPGMMRIGSVPNAEGMAPRLKVQGAFCLRRR